MTFHPREVNVFKGSKIPTGKGQRVNQPPKDFRNSLQGFSRHTLQPHREGADAHAGGSSEMQDHSVIKGQALEPDRWDPYISHYYY